MEVQPQLVLLQKTLLNIEGLGRQLYPDLDLWKTAKPFLERWMAEQIGPRALLKHLRKNVPLWAERLPNLPNLMYEVFEQIKKGKLQVVLDDEQIEQIQQDIHRANKRHYFAISGAGFVVTAAVVGLSEHVTPLLGPLPLFSWLLGGIGVALLAMGWPRRS